MPENSKETDKNNRIDMKDSKAGIIGDRATVHGGIHIITIDNVTVFRTVDDTTGEKEPDKKKIDIGPNPYISLNAFQERDADRFFGREKLTEKLWKKLRDLIEPGVEEEKVRFLPILGPSGSGKSSVARAGLVSELAKKPLPGYKKARVAVFTPGNMPVYAMAGVLTCIVSGESSPLAKADEFNEGLKKQNDKGEFEGLTRIAHIFPDIHFSPLIILVDQFEEIYSSRCEAKERNCFIDNLLHAASDAAGYVSVIITLRSDFLSETQSHRKLNRAIAENGEIVSVMDIEELRRAISKPSEKAGHPLDPLVVDVLIEQTKDREGALPLLQFALTQIWEGMAEGEAPAERLKKIGGVGGALAKEAHRLFSKLDPDDRLIVRRAFLAMVNLGEGVKDTRRRVRLENIVGGNEEISHVKKVLEIFSNRSARLVTFSGVEVEERSITVEITHEILLEQWEDLKDWLSRGRDELRLQRRLEQAAEHWKKENGSLWRSHDLYQAGKLYEKRKDDFTTLQEDFFLASRRAANRRWSFSILLTALIFLGVFAGFILINKEKRVAQENELMSNYHLALAYEKEAGIYLRLALSGDNPDENFQKAWLFTLAALNMNIPVEKDLPDSKERLGMKEIHLGLLRGVDVSVHQRYQGFATEDKTIREWESNVMRAYEKSGKMAPEFKAVYQCSFDLFPFRMDGISLVSIPNDAFESKPWYADYPRSARKDPIQWMVEAFAKALREGKISHAGIPKAWTDSKAKTISGMAIDKSEHKPFTNDVGMKFIYIEPGAFFMGSPINEIKWLFDGEFQMASLNKGFYMQTTEVTQEQWEAVMGNNPSYFKDCGKDCPVDNVSWNDAQEFIKKLNEIEGADIYRLPTEAEWEYAARAGTTTAFSFGNDAGLLDEYAWYLQNSDGKTHPVGSKKPNAWGLYDMHGNVWEWCEDHWHSKGAPVDIVSLVDGNKVPLRILRGGSWAHWAGNCRTADRGLGVPENRNSNSFGFRLVRLPGQRGEPGQSGKGDA